MGIFDRSQNGALVSPLAGSSSAGSSTPAGWTWSNTYSSVLNGASPAIVYDNGGAVPILFGSKDSASLVDDTNTVYSSSGSLSNALAAGTTGYKFNQTGDNLGLGNTGLLFNVSGNASNGNSGAVYTGSGAADLGDTGDNNLISGDATVGNSGHVIVRPGTAAGTRGKFKIVDGSEGTAGYVWTSTAVDGSGHWAAPGSLGNNVYLTARNFLNSADVNVLKVDANDKVQFAANGGTYFGAADPTAVANAAPDFIFNTPTGNHTMALFSGLAGSARGALAFITVNDGSFYIQCVASNDGTGATANVLKLNPQGSDVVLGNATGAVRSDGALSALSIAADNGASGSFTTVDAKTVTVVGGIITSIV